MLIDGSTDQPSLEHQVRRDRQRKDQHTAHGQQNDLERPTTRWRRRDELHLRTRHTHGRRHTQRTRPVWQRRTETSLRHDRPPERTGPLRRSRTKARWHLPRRRTKGTERTTEPTLLHPRTTWRTRGRCPEGTLRITRCTRSHTLRRHCPLRRHRTRRTGGCRRGTEWARRKSPECARRRSIGHHGGRDRRRRSGRKSRRRTTR